LSNFNETWISFNAFEKFHLIHPRACIPTSRKKFPSAHTYNLQFTFISWKSTQHVSTFLNGHHQVFHNIEVKTE
jgi:hypothetical protein